MAGRDITVNDACAGPRVDLLLTTRLLTTVLEEGEREFGPHTARAQA